MNQNNEDATPQSVAEDERPDLLDTSEEPLTPADRLGFEPFSYSERG
ncbi:hypothetical protein [Variovorax soli]|uniref:Uncharacterized protein n=1 Tax=Variovorax soli TaxID=376815 RepID=A0ABU1NLH7_9BURK|nr:hypothetical protein [Variovorax soli]MDR6538856.1 hypothetical protein [Variovorax soli]